MIGAKFPEKNECHFAIKPINGICSDEGTINIMRKMLNKMHIDNTKYDNSQVVEASKKALNCNYESCIIGHDKFSEIIGKDETEKIKKKIFKVSGPWDSDEWLSNSNIDGVLSQWKDVYPGYRHFCFKMNDTIKQLSISNEYKQRKMKTFSIVVNTDNLSGPGKHWFCIFGEFMPNSNAIIEYFNSSGAKPSPEVHEWLVKTCYELTKFCNIKTSYVMVSNIELQKSNSECGLFSLWYIYSRLEGVSYKFFANPESVTDDMMYEFRKYIFRRHP